MRRITAINTTASTTATSRGHCSQWNPLLMDSEPDPSLFLPVMNDLKSLIFDLARLCLTRIRERIRSKWEGKCGCVCKY